MLNQKDDETPFESGDEDGLSTSTKNEAVYPNAEIRINRAQFPLFQLKRMVDNRQLQLDPGFQRNNVWESKQKYELIESILMGIPLPVIYLFEDKNAKKQMVDGRQRITSIVDYMNNHFALQDLKILPAFNGKRFGDLDATYQNKIEEYQLHAYVIEPPTPEQVKYDIFDRVNRGGTELNTQEMRNALYYGKSTEMLKTLARLESFRRATDKKIDDTRMRAQYAILRLVGFYLYRTTKRFEYKSNINDFLAPVMQYLNQEASETERTEIKDRFDRAMAAIYDLFGKDAFRLPVSNEKRRPISLALFESLGYFFMIKDVSGCDESTLKSKLKEQIRWFDQSGSFKFAVDSATNVYYRFSEMEKLAEELRC
jgi:hypothetical protein